MPFYRVCGTMMHLKLGGKAKKNPPAACCARIEFGAREQRCRAISGYLCDFELDGGGACDAPLCAEHAHPTGPNSHLCPTHRAQQAEIELELF